MDIRGGKRLPEIGRPLLEDTVRIEDRKVYDDCLYSTDGGGEGHTPADSPDVGSLSTSRDKAVPFAFLAAGPSVIGWLFVRC